MNVLISLPAILSFLVLSAHFLRAGSTTMVVVCLGAPLLLIVRRTWAVKVVQGMLILGALLWIRTIIVLIDQRDQLGRPWLRMAIILGVVALFTFASSLLLMGFRVRKPNADAIVPNASDVK